MLNYQITLLKLLQFQHINCNKKLLILESHFLVLFRQKLTKNFHVFCSFSLFLLMIFTIFLVRKNSLLLILLKYLLTRMRIEEYDFNVDCSRWFARLLIHPQALSWRCHQVIRKERVKSKPESDRRKFNSWQKQLRSGFAYKLMITST